MQQTSIDKQQLEQLRSDLLREKNELADRMESSDKFGMNEPMGVELGELSLIDNHPADIGSELFERGKDLALVELWEHQLEKAEAALARMDNGTYGRCLKCGEAIPVERLQALPSAEYCIQHVPDDETSLNQRPLEEEFLEPAMRSDMDHDDTTQFDGEDAWQIVERWGTSNTPALQEGNHNTDYNEMYIESDENEGYVEPLESFLATDMYGNNVTFVRNGEYQSYLERGEGYGLLEPDLHESEDEVGGYF
jgi:YteA family regulatory protein